MTTGSAARPSSSPRSRHVAANHSNAEPRTAGLRIGCAVLAAGASRRFGAPKQLAAYGETSLLNHVLRQVCDSACTDVAVVLGAHAESVRASLPASRAVVLVNSAWSEGVGSSVRCSAAWASSAQLDALIIALGDQPKLDAKHVERLIGQYVAGAPLVASRYAGVAGVPALFGSRLFPALFSVNGDAGARDIVRAHPGAACVAWEQGARDVDIPEDLLPPPSST